MDRPRGRDAIGVITGVSTLNFSDEIRAGMDLPEKVIVNDLTLREGREIEGIVLNLEELIRIAKQLDDIGVPMIQMSMFSDEDYELHKAITRLDLKMEKETFCHGWQVPPFTIEAYYEVLDRIIDAGSVPDPPFALLEDMMLSVAKERGRDNMSIDDLKEEGLEIAVNSVHHAKSRGGAFNANLQDFMRCDMDYLRRFCRELEKAGVNVITLDDICNPALPAVYKYCAQVAKKAAPNTRFGVHVHQDFALALPGVLGALEGGVEVLDCGVNGYGERAGHAELAQLAIILEFLYGYDTGIKLERLTETARLFADIMRQPIPKFVPVTGENAYSHVADFHWARQGDFWAMNCLDPKVVGNTSRAIFGAGYEQIGPFGLRMKAGELGMTIPDEKIGPLKLAMSEYMKWAKRPLTDIELREIFEKVLL